MNLVLKTAPASEPVSLAEAKAHLRVDYDDDDITIITPLIEGARKYCENFQNRAYITQTWIMYLPWFSRVIRVPKGSLQSITSIKYKQSDGSEVTLTENTNYIYSKTGIDGLITTPYGVTWPSFTQYPLDAVEIEFVCGYGNSAAVPEPIKQAIKMLVKYWYDQGDLKKEVSEDIKKAVHDLLWQERIVHI